MSELADAWTALYKQTKSSDERDRLFWAFAELHELVRRDLTAAVKVMTEIASTDDEVVLSNVGAGPLEDLLVFHGMDAINLLRENDEYMRKIKICMKYVWQNAMSDEVWNEVQKIASSV